MRYVTGLIVFLFLLLLDIALILSCAALIGLFIILAMLDGGQEFPISFKFAKGLWLND